VKEMKETLRMTFRTALGKDRVMSIAGPRAGLAASSVSAAANMIIGANPFDAGIGALVSLQKAQRIAVDSKPVIVA
jgi:hypothetical protein